MKKFRDEAINRKRELAIDILKPSPKQIEYGLKLHEDALVIETYCLGLRAPVDAGVMQRLHDEGAGIREYKGTYSDMSSLKWALDENLTELYREAWEASGVTCTFQNAGEEGNDPMRLLQRLSRHICLTDIMPDFLCRALTAENIQDAHDSGKRCVCMALNGVPLAGDKLDVRSEMDYIRLFAQLGVRMMHFTYNRRNPMADGCGEPDNAGVSDFGRAVIGEMNRHGILIDLAHTGWQSCIDAARISDQPVVVSHSAVWELQHHVRCKPDNVIKAVLDTGGVMGITNVPAFLGGSGDIIALLDHIDYLSEKFGCDGISIGTDRAYAPKQTREADEKVPPLPKKSPARWESLWPPEHSEQMAKFNKPEKLQSTDWTNWPMITVGLVQRGYSDEDIRNILGGNMMRVLRQASRNPAYWEVE